MGDIDFDDDDFDGSRRPKLRAILITVLFPFLMGVLLGSIIKYNGMEKLIENPGGLSAILGVTTGATVVIWGAGLYQAIKKGRAFGIQKNTWSLLMLGGHVAGLITGAVFLG